MNNEQTNDNRCRFCGAYTGNMRQCSVCGRDQTGQSQLIDY